MTTTELNGATFHAGAKYLSPVRKMLILGWYDGPEEGVLETVAGEIFKFDILERVQPGLDDADEVRVYRLSPLPPDTLARLTRTLAPFHNPVWPVWAPIWRFPTDEDQRNVEQGFDQLIAKVSLPTWVIATRDLLGEITLAQPISEVRSQTIEWMALLGLKDKSALANY